MHIELTRADDKGKIMYPIKDVIVFADTHYGELTCYVRLVGAECSLPVKETYDEIRKLMHAATGVLVVGDEDEG